MKTNWHINEQNMLAILKKNNQILDKDILQDVECLQCFAALVDKYDFRIINDETTRGRTK